MTRPVCAVIDCGSRRLPAVVSILTDLGATTITVPLREANVLHGMPAFEQVNAVVVSGGPHLFTRDPAFIDHFSFLDRLEVPLLGICLGHQALGLRHGATIHRGRARRGSEVIHLGVAHRLFAGIDSGVQLEADHCEGIDPSPEFTTLARSEHYAVEAMAHCTRPWFGVQFHPETSGEAGRRLLANFLAIVQSVDPTEPPRDVSHGAPSEERLR